MSEPWLTFFGAVEMLIGELAGLPGVLLLQVFPHKLPPKERSGVWLARASGLLSTVRARTGEVRRDGHVDPAQAGRLP